MDIEIDLHAFLAVPDVAARFNSESANLGLAVRLCFIDSDGTVAIPETAVNESVTMQSPLPLSDALFPEAKELREEDISFLESHGLR